MIAIDPGAVPAVRWRNGAGTTRQVAVGRGRSGDVQWRVSVADLTCSASFSLFPGFDRLFVPLGPVRLVVDGDAVDLMAGDQHRFGGESVVEAVVGTATRALNVMTLRDGAYRSRVVLRPSRSEPGGAPAVSVLLGAVTADIHLEGPA